MRNLLIGEKVCRTDKSGQIFPARRFFGPDYRFFCPFRLSVIGGKQQADTKKGTFDE